MKNDKHKGVISWQFLQVMFQSKHHVVAIAERHGLTLMQCSALLILQPDQPAPMNTLSTTLVCDASNVTGIVDRLEERGLLERQLKAGDRRVKMVALTAAGRNARNQIMDHINESDDSQLAPVLTSTEISELARILAKIIGS